MKTLRRTWLRLAVLVLGGIALLPAVGARAASGNDEFRWDILQPTNDIVAGGEASALASDGSKITLTGSGTFRSNSGFPQDVTGGGKWKTTRTDNNGVVTVTGQGTYKVTAFVTFTLAPGTISGVMDFIGDLAAARAGIVVLRIAYSDGTQGTLTFSCMLDRTPDSVLEGITASKGFTDYWNSVIAPVTIFHLL